MYYIYNIIRYYITYLTQLVADDTFILDIAKDYSLLEQCTELLWLLTRILYLLTYTYHYAIVRFPMLQLQIHSC